MAVTGLLDLCVHMAGFRNLDLQEQGVFRLQVSVDAPATVYALEEGEGIPNNRHKLSAAVRTASAAYSRAFVIRYSEEDVHLHDLAVFQLRVDLAAVPVTLDLTVNLLFAEFTEAVLDTPPTLDQFASVSSQRLRINNAEQGTNQFVPVVFNDHPCQASLCVYSFLLGYEFDGRSGVSVDVLQRLFPHKTYLNASDVDMFHAALVRRMRMACQKNSAVLERCFAALPESERASRSLPVVPELEARRFSAVVCDRKIRRLAAHFTKQLEAAAAQTHLVELNLLELIKNQPVLTASLMQERFVQSLKEHWGGCIFRDFRHVSVLTEACLSGDQRKLIADTLRKTPLFANVEGFEVYQPRCFEPREFHPVLFQDISYTHASATEHSVDPTWFTFLPSQQFKQKGIHLIVLVHGFQGSAADVRGIKNAIAAVRPDCLVICSSINEGQTEGDIADMGSRLAHEVNKHLSDWACTKLVRKLSFIGHSLGGIIIRAALPHLRQHSRLFHLFMTFSSPHLGYMHNSSAVISAGMWLLQRWSKSKCLKQLSMTDSYTYSDTFLFKLSQEYALANFKHVALVGSPQDTYAPYESARIEVSRQVALDQACGRFHIEMANNILGPMSAGCVHRLDVNYKAKSKSLDNWIGRSAHIEMLENESLMQMVLFSCAHFFE